MRLRRLGFLDVGGARTALFNWLFARREGGTLLLRVEDTDVERNRPELVDGILDSLKWLGIAWDEGPYFQSQRLPMYQKAAEKLLAGGAAYACYCKASQYAGADAAPPADEVDDEGDAESSPTTAKAVRRTACECRNLSAEERAAKERAGEARAIRCLVPRSALTKFEDAVFGAREIQNEEIEDFVLLRSNGLPTYQLGAVVDDIDMRITHVIRGADHLSNTPKQVLLYRALGAEAPAFAHVPLDSGAGPDATVKAARRDKRGAVRRGGIFARGVPKFSVPAGVVGGRGY